MVENTIEDVFKNTDLKKIQFIIDNSSTLKDFFIYFDIKVCSRAYVKLKSYLLECNISIENMNKVKNKPGVYKIINIINGKIYIGSSVNVRKRKNLHFSRLRKNTHECKHLQSAFNKYGEEKFKFEIIEYIKDKNKIIEREQYWIDNLKPYDKTIGYNSRKIAENNLHTKRSEEDRIKCGLASKGKKMSEEAKDKIRLYQKGRKKSPETLEKMRIVRSGEGSGVAKLSNDDILKIKELLNDSYAQTYIAEIFNVSPSTISKIKNNHTWKLIS